MREALRAQLHGRRDLRDAPRELWRHVRRPTPPEPALTRVRILLVSQMYPGPEDPDLGSSSRRSSARSPRAGTRSSSPCSTGAAAASAATRALARRAVRRRAQRFQPDVVYAHFLVPAGLIAALAAPRAARRHRARPGRPRTSARSRGVRAPPRYVVAPRGGVIAVSDYLRRELEAKRARARAARPR